MINTAFGFPFASIVKSPDDISREPFDLYKPGDSVNPPMFPAKRTISVAVLPAASLYAFVRSPFAVVKTVGVGEAKSDAYKRPVTSAEAAAGLFGGRINEKPVRKLPAAGLSPIFPVIEDVGTLVT